MSTTIAPVILWHEPSDDAARATADHLADSAHAAEIAVHRPNSTEALARTLQVETGARLVVLCPDALSALCSALQDGISPTKALAEWQARAVEARDLIRQARMRARIVPPDMLADNCAEIAAWLGFPQNSPASSPSNGPTRDPLLRMIARTALAEDAPALALAQELEASTLGTTADCSLMTEEAATQLFGRLRDRDETMHKLASDLARTEAALTDRLTHAQQETEQSTARVRELETQLEARTTETDLLREQFKLSIDDLTREHSRTEAALTDRLTHAQQETEQSTARVRELETQLEARTTETDLLREQFKLSIDDLTREHSQTEAVLSDQLTHAQQETEQSFVRARELETQLEARTTETELLREQFKLSIDDLTREHSRTEAVLSDRLTHAHQEIEQSFVRARELETQLEARTTETGLLREQLKLSVDDLAREHNRNEATQTQFNMRMAEHARTISEKNDKLRALSANKKEAETRLQESHAVCERLEQQLHQLRQGLESHQAELRIAQTARHDLARQLEQMHDIREELEPYYHRAETLEQRAAELEARIQALASDIATRDAALTESRVALRRIERSRSYRMMAPLRFVSGLFTRKDDPDV